MTNFRENRGARCFFLVALCGLFGPAAFLPAAALAQEEGGRGFLEARASVFTETTGESWQMVQRFRPTLQMSPGERVALVVTVEAGLSQGRDMGAELRRTVEESDFGPFLELAGCTWPDQGHSIFRIHDSGDYLEVDRLYLDVYQGAFDLRIGRQSIHWGSAQFFNPTDPFPEVLLAEPWRPRRGINALRFTLPFGSMNDITALAAIDDPLENGRLAGRLRVNLAGMDIALLGAWRGDLEDTLVGLDLRGTTVVGWWVEGALLPGSDAHTELAIGIDYSFPVFDRMLVFAQYFRNGAGATRPDDYERLPALAGAKLPSCETDLPGGLQDEEGGSGSMGLGASGGHASPFAPIILARDYLLLGTMIAFSPDLSMNAFLLQNLNDGTALVVPTLSFIAGARLELSLSAQIPFTTWGEGGELRPRPQDLHTTHTPAPGADPLVLDLSGLVPSSTITLWARYSI